MLWTSASTALKIMMPEVCQPRSEQRLSPGIYHCLRRQLPSVKETEHAQNTENYAVLCLVQMYSELLYQRYIHGVYASHCYKIFWLHYGLQLGL